MALFISAFWGFNAVDQPDRLDSWVNFKIVCTIPLPARCARKLPDVAAIAAVGAKFNVVAMGSAWFLREEYQLVLRAVE